MKRAIENISAIFAVLAAVCVLAMMVLTCLDTGMRWATGRSLAGVQEIVEQLMVAIVFLGMAYALRRGEHVSVKLLTDSLPPRMASALRLVGLAVMVGIIVWITYRTGQHAWRSFTAGEVRFGLLQVPIWPARLAIPLGLSALLLQALIAVRTELYTLRTGRPGAGRAEHHAF